MFNVHASGCATSNSNVAHVSSGKVRTVIHRAVKSCMNLLLPALQRVGHMATEPGRPHPGLLFQPHVRLYLQR